MEQGNRLTTRVQTGHLSHQLGGFDYLRLCYIYQQGYYLILSLRAYHKSIQYWRVESRRCMRVVQLAVLGYGPNLLVEATSTDPRPETRPLRFFCRKPTGPKYQFLRMETLTSHLDARFLAFPVCTIDAVEDLKAVENYNMDRATTPTRVNTSDPKGASPPTPEVTRRIVCCLPYPSPTFFTDPLYSGRKPTSRQSTPRTISRR